MKLVTRFITLLLFTLILFGCNLPNNSQSANLPLNPPDADQAIEENDSSDSEQPSQELAPTESSDVQANDASTQTPQPTDTPPTQVYTPVPAAWKVRYQSEYNNSNGWQSFAWWQSNVKSLAGGDYKAKISTYVAEVSKGKYHFEVPKKYTNITSIYGAGQKLSDLSVVADTFITIDRPWTFISLVCRYDANLGWYQFYIQSDGYWAIRKISYVNGTLYDVKDLANGFSSAINYGYHGAMNELKATCKGNQLTFIVNSITLGSVKDSSYSSGLFGVGVAAGEQGNSQADFDNIMVLVP